MTPIVNNIIAGVSLLIILAITYLVKQVFDSERILATHPYFRNKILRTEIAGLVIFQAVAMLQPGWFPFPWIGFLTCFALILSTFAYLYDKHVTKLPVNYSGVVGAAVYIAIPTSHYVTVAPGVRDRRIPSRFDPEWIMMKRKYPQLSEVKFRDNYVISVQYDRGGDFPEHSHLSLEKFTVLSGSVEMMPGEVVSAGETYIIPANVKHYFKIIEPGACVIEYSKIPADV